uniref:Uncharacterized protein n=1 Tax=Rhizophora mucronata TaxID=61149 RepID=A0A2P2NK57_RHIMU
MASLRSNFEVVSLVMLCQLVFIEFWLVFSTCSISGCHTIASWRFLRPFPSG